MEQGRAVLAFMSTVKVNSPAATTITQTLRGRRKAISVEDLAELLDCSKQWLYDNVKRGTIPAAKLPGMIRFDPVLVAAWWEERSA